MQPEPFIGATPQCPQSLVASWVAHVDRSTLGGNRVLVCAVTVHVIAKTCSSCLLANDLPTCPVTGASWRDRGRVEGHCASGVGLSFLSGVSRLSASVLGGIAVLTEQELASSPRGAVPWGQPHLTPLPDHTPRFTWLYTSFRSNTLMLLHIWPRAAKSGLQKVRMQSE